MVKNNFILLSHWVGLFGNRMNQYAYASTYKNMHDLDFYVPSKWEGSVLFKNQQCQVIDNPELCLELNRTRFDNEKKNIIEKFYPEAIQIDPQRHPENYMKYNNPIYFNSICTHRNYIYSKMNKKFLLEIFEFSDLVKNTDSYKKWESIKGTYDVAHLRRGEISDPEHNRLHPNQNYSVISKNSYYKAFNKYNFNSDNILWVSDDYTKKWHTDKKESVRLSWKYPEGSEFRKDIIFDWLDDFLCMYFARTIFRANSNFSWWAAFLSPTAQAYSPILDKSAVYGKDDKYEEIEVEFVKGNHPHYMYYEDDIRYIIINE